MTLSKPRRRVAQKHDMGDGATVSKGGDADVPGACARSQPLRGQLRPHATECRIDHNVAHAQLSIPIPHSSELVERHTNHQNGGERCGRLSMAQIRLEAAKYGSGRAKRSLQTASLSRVAQCRPCAMRLDLRQQREPRGPEALAH